LVTSWGEGPIKFFNRSPLTLKFEADERERESRVEKESESESESEGESGRESESERERERESCCIYVLKLLLYSRKFMKLMFFFTCKLLFYACKLVFYTRMLLFYVCKLLFYTRNLSFYIRKLEEVWNSNVLIYIGQARWSQIVHTITSPPSLLRRHSSAFLLLTEPIRQKFASYFFQK